MQVLEILLYLGIFIIASIYCVLSLEMFKTWFALLQQNHYYNLISLKNYYLQNSKIKRYFYLILLITFVICVACVLINVFLKIWYVNLIANIFIVIVLGLFWFNKIRKTKLKISLKTTKRIKRLFFTFILLNFISYFLVLYFLIIKNNYYLLFTIPLIFFCEGLIITLANLLNNPIEKLINYSYIVRAKQKLKQYPNLIVIGITGSFGKTSTKNYLCEMLKQKYNVLITPNSYNTPMGITKTILENLNSSYDIFIVEMGADHNNDIKKLCKIIAPHISIITSVGSQHLKTFKSIDNIINTKYQIVQYAKNNVKFFTNTDNKICKIYYDVTKCEKFDIGTSNICFCKIDSIKFGDKITFNLLINNNSYCFKTNLLGIYNIYNIALSVCVAITLGVEINKLKSTVENLKAVSHRLELKSLSSGALLIDDSFNSNPNGAKQSLDVLQGFKNKIKIVLTCGMVELGGKQYEENFEFGKNIAKVADLVFIINKVNKQAIFDGLKSANYNLEKIKFCNTFIEAYSEANKIANSKHIILIENDLPDNYN